MNFNKSVVATFVGAALTTMSLGVVAGSTTNMTAPAKVFSINARASIANLNSTTKSGMRNEFDKSLGQTTFQWAGVNEAKPDMGAIAPKYQNAYAAEFYLNKLTGLSAKKSTLVQPVLANVHDLGRGARIAKYKQEVLGVEVFNREFNIMMDREFNLVASSGYFVNAKSSQKLAAIKDMNAAFGDSTEAVKLAFVAMGGSVDAITLDAKDDEGTYSHFAVANTSTGKQLIGEPRAKKVFYEYKGQLVAAHYVEVETSSIDTVDSDYFGYVIAAKTGKILFKKNLTSHAEKFNYRAYADENGKPWDSPHGNVIPAAADADPAAFLTAPYLDAPLISLSSGPISTADAWLADDATTTQGNNVFAYVDAIAPTGFTNGDFTAQTTSTFTFDYSYDVNKAEYAMDNRKAAIVSLFVLNNYLHDDYYDHGFDEASGNAQAVNYGRGGVEGDAINAEVQDNSGFNNANMSTPADGGSPRMQMFLWETTQAINGVDFALNVTSHPTLGLLQDVQFASFGADVYSVKGDLVRIDDATGVVTDGCEAATNGAALAGKIAVIDRGACNFTVKVKNAQDAGAIAVLVANNKDGNIPAPMGGADDTVTIPSMGISQDEGNAIYALLDASETVSVDMFKNDLTRNFKGSSWDTAIAAHEWAHYLTNRLVGNGAGLGNNQGGSMGEGWSDFVALLAISDASDSMMAGNEMFGAPYAAITYVASFTKGIRQYPYTTNMAINPFTFKDVTADPEVHGSGTVWASMLWDAYVGLINDDRHTFAQAQSLMKDYLVASLKMTPVTPTFTEARDALFAAAYANDVDDYKIIVAAFARRGMGIGALSPDRFSTDHTGVVESYKTELATFNVTANTLDTNYEGLTTGYCSNDNILDKGETGTVSFSVKNTGTSALTGVIGKIEVMSGQDVTFANDGIVTIGDVAMFGSATSAPIEFTLNDAGTGDNLVLKLTFPDLADGGMANDYSLATTVNVDFKTRELVGTSQYENLNTLSRLKDFTETVMVGGDMAKGTFGLDQWTADDGLISSRAHSFTSDVAYQTRTMQVGFAGDFTISWWHLYNLEENWDGAVVEVKVNGGDWADVTTMGGTFQGAGYSNTLFDFTEAALAGKEVFSGLFAGWETVSFGNVLNGNEVQFRFRQATDSAFVPPAVQGFAAGWYIDDITFTNIANSIFSDVVAGDSFACDNRLPMVDVGGDISATGGASVSFTADAVDANGDALTYAWTQTAGTTASLTGADSATLSFTAPTANSGSETLTFELTVNDGTGTVTKSKSVNVTNAPVIITTPKDTSSGGSTGLLALLLLPLAMFRRRK
ncbi:MAG: rhombosortase-dependent M36 family metallopeptidase [Alteromonadaceae bacterium]|nr:rhombosortase-dependent M36 family metallopeptidase [Alteromonadaceae bacterium]